jgi:hypothetical protein
MTTNYKELIETKTLAMNEATCQLILPALHWDYDQITNILPPNFVLKGNCMGPDTPMTRSNNHILPKVHQNLGQLALSSMRSSYSLDEEDYIQNKKSILKTKRSKARQSIQNEVR